MRASDVGRRAGQEGRGRNLSAWLGENPPYTPRAALAVRSGTKSAFQNLVRLIRRECETGDILGRFASFRSVLLNFKHPNGGFEMRS